MAKTANSLLELLTNQHRIDSRIRSNAAMCVKRYLQTLIARNKVEDINDDDIEELAFDLIDELATESYMPSFNN
jgi:hypothetical protein